VKIEALELCKGGNSKLLACVVIDEKGFGRHLLYHVFATNARGLFNGEHVKMGIKKSTIWSRNTHKPHVERT